MRHSLYWDDFSRRVDETVSSIRTGKDIPVRRVAIFITDKCNLRCKYCNSANSKNQMSEETFDRIIHKYPEAIIHITGGEPSVVDWLYPYLIAHGDRFKFHLNTNCVIPPPAKSIKRLKVSLDSCESQYWNSLVGRNVFDKVVSNIKNSLSQTVTSITYTMTRENYQSIPKFIEFIRSDFSGLYAIFFSVYKGTNPDFAFTAEDVETFFNVIRPQMTERLDSESRALFEETIDEKFRLISGVRFPENEKTTCYISLSERVFDFDGTESACSHLFRDGIKNSPGQKDQKCLYGCNRRLVAFNQEVTAKLKEG